MEGRLRGIIDSDIPNINVPILEPTPYKRAKVTKMNQAISSLPMLKKQITRDIENYILNARPIVKERPQNIIMLKNLIKDLYKQVKPKEPRYDIELSNSALKNATEEHVIQSHIDTDEISFLDACKIHVISFLSRQRNKKVTLRLDCEMLRVNNSTGEESTNKTGFWSSTYDNFTNTNLSSIYDKMKDEILSKFAEYLGRGSGLRLGRVIKLVIKTRHHKPLKGAGNKLRNVKLPDDIMRRKAVINMDDNKDNQCFKWAVTRAANPVSGKQHPNYVNDTLKKQSNVFNWDNITFPMEVRMIKKFEKQNQHVKVGNKTGVSINVYYIENEICDGKVTSSISPLEPSKFVDDESKYPIDLLYYDNHYCVISNLSRLLSCQISKHDGAVLICRRCLNTFTTKNALDNHSYYCKHHEPAKVLLDKKPIVFKNYNHSMRVPFVFYADFESFTKPINVEEGKIYEEHDRAVKEGRPFADSELPAVNISYTNSFQEHVPNSFCIYLVTAEGIPIDNSLQQPIRYTVSSSEATSGERVGKIFVEKLEEFAKQVYERYEKVPQPMIFTEEDKIAFNNASTCHICDNKFISEKMINNLTYEYDECQTSLFNDVVKEKLNNDKEQLKKYIKVRDHFHISGKYRGAI